MPDMQAPLTAEQVLAATRLVRPVLDQIADKWSVLILTVICTEPARFNAIRRRLDGITQRALTQTLRRLERNGLVTRRVIASSPVAVEYSLTPLGHTLQQPFAALYAWTVEHMAEVEQAQGTFDRATEADAALTRRAEGRLDAALSGLTRPFRTGEKPA